MKHYRNKFFTVFLFHFLLIISFLLFTSVWSNSNELNKTIKEKEAMTESISQDIQEDVYQSYINFFEEVYDTMQTNYYQDVSKEAYDQFVEKFRTKIYSQLKGTGKSDDFVRWRSASFLVEALKSQEDVFSEFYPPKPAKEYEQTALGRRIDLGIEGVLNSRGFQVNHVEPRSDAYVQGLRVNDVILKIDGKKILKLKEGEVNDLLNPLADTKVKLTFLDFEDKGKKDIEVVSKEYFKQTVFMIPPKVSGIFGIEIRRFNRKTAEDLLRYINFFKENGPVKGLIVDLRGNPGGPPLAAREISSFFLPAGSQFAYFHKKGHPKAELDVPEIPAQFHYAGPMVILINEGSGSASELFSGILQRRGRAVLMGTNSAGQVMLKSMFHFDDESMVLLITSRGHHPDGAVFSFNGLTPDRYVEEMESDEIYKHATNYLVYKNLKDNESKNN